MLSPVYYQGAQNQWSSAVMGSPCLVRCHAARCLSVRAQATELAFRLFIFPAPRVLHAAAPSSDAPAYLSLAVDAGTVRVRDFRAHSTVFPGAFVPPSTVSYTVSALSAPSIVFYIGDATRNRLTGCATIDILISGSLAPRTRRPLRALT